MIRALILAILLISTSLHGTVSTQKPGGLDYVYPAAGLTGCGPWTWLTACYADSTRTDSHVSPHDLLRSDIAFITANHLGTVQRVWISLDALMLWDADQGYLGFDRTMLANVADMVQQFSLANLQLDLVLYTFSAGPGGSALNPGYQYQFHPEALDGNHGVMRTDYRTAVYDFMAWLSTLPNHGAIQTIDLENEVYYQLEQYYLVASHLGKWMACRSTSGAVITSCIDARIIAPWVRDLYTAAHAAWPSIKYTASDTGRLLTTDLAQQQYWEGLYPVDTYDVHLYADDPAAAAARWATGLLLHKPWFAGEVGCAVSHVACTYDGAAALPVDGWWLANLPQDGARAVLLEDRRTAFTYSYDASQPFSQRYVLTPTGQLLAGL